MATGPKSAGGKRPRSWKGAIGPLLRAFLLASAAIGASVWALVRYYTHPRPPMIVVVPVVDAGDTIPAPDLVADE